jgi:cell division protein FtsB
MADSGIPAPDGSAPAPAAAPAPGGAPAEGPDLAFLVAAGIALVAALVLVRNLLPAKQDLADSLRREESLKKEIEALGKERGLLGLKEKALKDDPAYIERVLRDQTGMSRPGEFLVR